MRPWTVGLASAAVGFGLGWLTRPLVEGRGASLAIDEVIHHAFADEDRLTQAVTLFALLELHKRGEASWEQPKLFGPIQVAHE